MLFLLLIPAWLICVVVGMVLLFMRQFQRIGIYTITVSSTAVLVAFALSGAILYAGPRLVKYPAPAWYGMAIMAAYFVSTLVGGVVGALAGLFGTRRLMRKAE